MEHQGPNDSQPGLEVDTGLQNGQHKQTFSPNDGHQGLIHSTQRQQYPPNTNGGGSGPTGKKMGILNLLLIGGAVLIALIAFAGVIGGIIGWKVTEGKNNTSTPAATPGSSNDTAPTTPTTCANSSPTAGANQTIRANSALTVTGWRYGTGFVLRLFYQGPDNLVRYSVYDTMYEAWAKPYVLDISAQEDTPLAASTIWWMDNITDGNQRRTQIQLFYTDLSSGLVGINWPNPSVVPPAGSPDSINGFKLGTSSPSRLASYWPSIILQDPSDIIQDIAYTVSSGYTPTEVSTSGGRNSPLLALPLTSTHANKDLRVLYRRYDGKLYDYNRASDGTANNDSGALSFSIPDGAGMGGFATASGIGTALKTYVLWQDTTTGVIQIVHEDGEGSGWQGPTTDPVFDGADNGTQIACVTAAGTNGGEGDWAEEVKLQTTNDMNRCYFQVGGALKEVWFDGSTWSELGFVNMPK